MHDAPIGGAVYVFQVLDGITISQVAKLTASNGMNGDVFGYSVTIHGKYILVGAHGVDSFAGSAYLFGNPSDDPNTPQWTQLVQIQPDDLTAYHSFGVSVTMDDDIAIIGTSDPEENAAYVFVPITIDDSSSSLSMSWTQTAKLTIASELLGCSVSVAGNWIVVGAPSDDSRNGSDAGAVLVFTKLTSSSLWTQMARLLAADGSAMNLFGYSVSISRDASTIVVGAIFGDFSANLTETGAAYLFHITNSTMTTTSEWTQVGKFMAPDREIGDGLGHSVAIENNIVVVGAGGDDSFTGSVYVLDTDLSPSPTTAPTQATTTPTGEPTAIVTLEPTLSPTRKPSISPTTMVPCFGNDNNGNSSPPSLRTINPSSPPVPIQPLEPPSSPTTNPATSNNTFTIQPSPTEQYKGNSGSTVPSDVIVRVSAIVVAGVGGVAALIAFFNFRLKRKAREQHEQQQQQEAIHITDDPFLPPAAVENETLIMADAVFDEPNSIRTLVADAFLDSTANATRITADDRTRIK
jgi:hypothetical protein